MSTKRGSTRSSLETCVYLAALEIKDLEYAGTESPVRSTDYLS